jgi:hypothetical protein
MVRGLSSSSRSTTSPLSSRGSVCYKVSLTPTQFVLIDTGVHGVQHLASDVSFSSDYEKVVNASRDMTTTFLNAVLEHDSVKSVVLTSSRIAAYNPVYGKDIHATKNDWTDYFLDLAKNAPAEDPMAPMMICESQRTSLFKALNTLQTPRVK